ncbi:hypothetical protein [Flavobacterium aquiphilum]|uniref:hypothetical protein n=1 Tax=Flavobacterium aquiphilum TaxID=3003261 RepID=UPI0024811584|nr:hypothetical protein [Flavobacterium aquiphilum]
MDVTEKLTALLTDKKFSHNGKELCFLSCKKVNSNIMVLTNKETIPIPVDRFVDFYNKVEKNCSPVNESKSSFVPAEIPIKNKAIIVPEMPGVFGKINQSFDSLIDAIENASDADMKVLEVKAKMLTSMAQTAVNMENSRINLIKLFNGK